MQKKIAVFIFLIASLFLGLSNPVYAKKSKSEELADECRRRGKIVGYKAEYKHTNPDIKEVSGNCYCFTMKDTHTMYVLNLNNKLDCAQHINQLKKEKNKIKDQSSCDKTIKDFNELCTNMDLVSNQLTSNEFIARVKDCKAMDEAIMTRCSLNDSKRSKMKNGYYPTINPSKVDSKK